MMERHLKSLLLFGETAEQKYLSLPPLKNYIVKKKTKEKDIF